MPARATPLRDQHCACGGRLVDFAGWELPLHYGSQVAEHHAVRRAAGVFDVSHLALTIVSGRGAKSYLRRLLVIGAGSTLTKPAPDDRLTFERARQFTHKSWKRPEKKK